MIYVVSRRPDLDYSGYEIDVITPAEAKKLLKDEKEFELDVETTGLLAWKDKLLTYQVGTKEDQFVFDAITVPITEGLHQVETSWIWAHNAKFELGWLYRAGLYPKRVTDTMLQERILHMGDLSHKSDLKSCVMAYVGYDEAEQMDKDSRNSFDEESIFDPEFILYSAGDVTYLRRIDQQQKVLGKQKSCLTAFSIDNTFVKACAYLEQCGMYLDTDEWIKKMARDYKNLDDRKKELDQHILDENIETFINYVIDSSGFKPHVTINWDSPKQVLEFFHAKGIYPQAVDKKTGVVKNTVNADVLKKHSDPIIPVYISYKEYAKKWGAYGHNFLILRAKSPDGRIRTIFNQIINTGRMSSGSRKLKLTNFQNIPKPKVKWDSENHCDKVVGNWERLCFTPEKGNVFVVSDFSQQEQVIMANKSKDPGLLKFFRSGGGDMHSFVAQSMYPSLAGLELHEIKQKFKNLRDNAKSVGFTINYGGSEKTLSNNLGISMQEASEIFKAFFTAFPGVESYLEKQKQEAWDYGEVLIDERTGRRAYFPEWQQVRTQWDSMDWSMYRHEKDHDTVYYREELKPLVSRLAKYKAMIQKSSLNYPIQGTAAEMTKMSGILIFDWICKNKLQDKVLINNIIHDEYLIECPRSIAEDVRAVVEESMNKAGKLFCPVIACKADAGITDIWHH